MMDRATLSRLSNSQLLHMIFLIIQILCERRQIVIDRDSIISVQFPQSEFERADAPDDEIIDGES